MRFRWLSDDRLGTVLYHGGRGGRTGRKRTKMSGLLALLDDVAAIAKLAAAQVDDLYHVILVATSPSVARAAISVLVDPAIDAYILPGG